MSIIYRLIGQQYVLFFIDTCHVLHDRNNIKVCFCSFTGVVTLNVGSVIFQNLGYADYLSPCIYSYYDTKAVFLALIITAVVCIIVTIFCFQTKVQLRMWNLLYQGLLATATTRSSVNVALSSVSDGHFVWEHNEALCL